MKFAAALSVREDADGIAAEIHDAIAHELSGAVDLALLFASGLPPEAVESAAGQLYDRLQPGCYLGCTCEGVIGGGREVERPPGVSVLAGSLPGVDLHPFRIGREEWPELLLQPAALKARVRSLRTPAAFLLLGDPFSTPAHELLDSLAVLAPNVPVVGGMASGGAEPGSNRLFYQDLVDSEGLVGVSLSGDVAVQAVVSQGCRPIGPVLLVTEAEENLIHRLADRPALQMLQEVVSALPPHDLSLARQGLLVGLVIAERADELGRGDVLVRSLAGADPRSGVVAIGDRVTAGQTLQLYVRDAASADAELRRLLATPPSGLSPAAGLLVSCNGRGLRMFDAPNHDAHALTLAFPALPVGGFFAMGEIGSIGGRAFLHGHTASIALFSPRPS